MHTFGKNTIRNVGANPHIVDEIFSLMLNELLEKWIKETYELDWYFIRYEY